MFEQDNSDYDPSPSEMAKVVEQSVRELINKHVTTITTFNVDQPWMQQVSTIRYDSSESVLRTYGAIKCEHTEEQHKLICKSVCYSFVLNMFRLTLLDGGNGVYVPAIFDLRDPAIHKFKIV